MFGHASFMFKKNPPFTCFIDATGGDLGAGGDSASGSVGFQVTDNGPESGVTQGQDGHSDAGDDDDSKPLYTKRDVETMIRGRLEAERAKLEKQYADAPVLRSLAERLQRTTGMTADQIIARIDQYMQAESARRMGLSPQVADEIYSARSLAEQNRLETLNLRMDLEERDILNDPYFVGYNEIRDKVREMSLKTGMSLKKAYAALTVGDPKIEAQRQREAEARLQHSIRQKAGRGTVAGDSPKGGQKLEYTPEQETAAKIFGMDIEEYLISEKSRDIDEYRYLMAQRNEKLKGGKK